MSYEDGSPREYGGEHRYNSQQPYPYPLVEFLSSNFAHNIPCLSYVCRVGYCGQAVQDRPKVCIEVE